MSVNIFEVAVRNKFRFPFKGQISVEDLWDLDVEDLDSIFKTLNAHQKQSKEESLLKTETKEDRELEVKIEIVKYIVRVKLEEQQQKIKAKEKKEQKQMLLEILKSKQNEELRNKSIPELEKMIQELDD